DPHRVPASLCSGVESHRIHLGLLQPPQTPQRLPQGLLRIETRRPSRTPEHAPPPHPDHRLLETGFFMARMTLYYAELSNSTRPIVFRVRRLIGIGAAVARRPLPHHRAYGSVHGGSRW